MAKKNVDMHKCDSKQSAASRDLEGMRDLLTAATALEPTIQAAATFAEYSRDFGELDLRSLHLALRKHTSDCSDGNLERAASMLTAQAHTLDAIFSCLARLAVNAEYVDHLDCQLKLALRAQSQCRATWEALATIQNPPAMGYIRQANIAHGPQQVNNAPSSKEGLPGTQKSQSPKNKVLEKRNGKRLEPGTARPAGRVDPAMEAVGEIHRTENS